MTGSGVDLHVHSNASDGSLAPRDVVRRAFERGLHAIALTDHDTLEGLAEARREGERRGLRVVAGCEFSVAVDWGEMHLLGYFLPAESEDLKRFLDDQRAKRLERARTMVWRLNERGLAVKEEEVLAQAGGGAVGRPHVARALVARGDVPDVGTAFDRHIGFGRPAFVPKELPTVEQVTALVRACGGVTSAAHLRERATARALRSLVGQGVDGVEVVHPSHDDETTARIGRLALEHRMVPTGGSDWHGADDSPRERDIGSLHVPLRWLHGMEKLHEERAAT